MPVDNRRLPAPEISVPYDLYSHPKSIGLDERLKAAVDENGIRLDGRKTDEQRKIFLKCGVVSHAKGSVYMEMDKTKLIVSVYDPKEMPKKSDYSSIGELYCEFKFAPFSCPKRRMHIQDAEEKQNSAILKRALESAVRRHEFPNSQVDIYVLVLENDGSTLSAAITAAGLALAHAAIPMYDTITAVTLGVQMGKTFIDPTLEEETICDVAHTMETHRKKEKTVNYSNHGIIVLAMLSTHQQVTEFYQTGNLNLEQLSEGVDVLTKYIKNIVVLVEQTLASYVVKSVEDNEKAKKQETEEEMS